MSSLLPTAKHSRDLHAHKIKIIRKSRYIQQHKKSRAVAVDRKYQGSKIIGMFGMLIHSYVF